MEVVKGRAGFCEVIVTPRNLTMAGLEPAI
jgi:hypothetical protein